MSASVRNFILVLFCLQAGYAHAQMVSGSDTLYGNEWIDFSKTYYAIKVAEDGVYRISGATLENAGISISGIPAASYRLFLNGNEVPLFVSNTGTLGTQDYLEFYGEKNRSALDSFLFNAPAEQMVNPEYALFQDTARYFLTVDGNGQALRYETLTNDLSNPPPADSFCWYDEKILYTNQHLKRRISNEITFSWFDGNGYGRVSNSTTATFNLAKPLPSSDAMLSLRYACDLGFHLQNTFVNGQVIHADTFTGWNIVENQFSLDAGLINAPIQVKLETGFGSSDRHCLSKIAIRYKRLFEFTQAKQTRFDIPVNPSGNYLEIKDFQGGTQCVAYDPVHMQRMEAVQDGALWKIAWPSHADSIRQLILSGSAGIHSVSELEAHQFRDFSQENADFILLYNPALNDGSDPVKAYADYRRSPEGGAHIVAEVDINELYLQFGYGQRFHPISIRNFTHFVHKNWSDAAYLLILGKGLEYPAFRLASAQQNLADSLFFIPMFSTPGADLPFVMERNRVSLPILSVGRLAVTNAQQIRDYLDKLKSHEFSLQTASQTLDEKAWRKRILHLSGGLAGETVAIKNYVNSMEATIEQNRFGADVHTFYKTSNDPVQVSAYNQIVDLVNDGLAVWMFFGHSSSNAVDFDIGSVSVYDNKDRYPLMMIMGCFSGVCSNQQQGLGEQFVLAKEQGAIAYFASVNFSFSDALNIFGDQYYQQLGGVQYGNGVGEVMRATIDQLQSSNYDALKAVLHQNVLQGDPAAPVTANPGPDYLIDPASVQFNPNPVGLESPEFGLAFDVVNIGEHPGGNLSLDVEQALEDGSRILVRRDTISAPPFRSTLNYQLSTSTAHPGFNRFFITVDPANAIAELPGTAEFNNQLIGPDQAEGVEVYFFSNDVQPVYPDDFGIVGRDSLVLYASAFQSGSQVQTYLMEIDTSPDFQSPLRRQTEFFQNGGLLEWTPNIPLVNETVYYWRTARDSLVNGAVPWRNRSFLWLEGSGSGWNQSHGGQIQQDSFVNLQWDSDVNALDFVDNASYVWVKVAWRNTGRYPGLQNAFIEGSTGDYGWNQEGILRGVVLMVVDENSGKVIKNPIGGPYSTNPDKETFYYWFDTQDSLKRIALMEFIENEIPEGAPVALLAFNTPNDPVGYAPHRWALDSVSYGKNIFQVLENQGASEVRNLESFPVAPYPYGLVFKKNDPDFIALDTTVYNTDSAIVVRGDFFSKWATGLLTTPLIGPAQHWDSLVWRRAPHDDPSDIGRLLLFAHLPDGQDSLIRVFEANDSLALDWISAEQFPYLRLHYDATDTLTRTVSQIQQLRVFYEGLPEGAALFQSFYADTVLQGEGVRGMLRFKNLSDARMDSLWVRYRLEGSDGNQSEWFERIGPLAVDSLIELDFDVETRTLQADQRLLVEFNAEEDQPERYHFNNVWVRDFYVSKDIRNPILDVTFDANHILDNALVSPKPLIEISLRDENPFLGLSDSSLFALQLTLPNGQVQQLDIHSPDFMLFPADSIPGSSENRSRLEWRPYFETDGFYTLSVNGRDASGNPSGTLDYSVRFQVINQSAVSNLLNYPNPFSTNTCFVYTLTGLESPPQFKMQIMTVSGKVVREVLAEEFGPLKPGTHVSDFCWDGTDQYGGQLANGVYLYRLIMRKEDGSDFEQYKDTRVDGMFTNGIGKMVLIR